MVRPRSTVPKHSSSAHDDRLCGLDQSCYNARDMQTARKSVLLATDGICIVQTDSLARGLNRLCKHIRFESRAEHFDLGNFPLSHPSTYSKLAKITQPLLTRHSCIVIASDLPYDNNYFWQSNACVVITSFWGWSSLTNLPKNNGMIGFIESILALNLDASNRHDDNTGCIYDF